MGDFDEDGDLDLSTANFGSSTTSILINTAALYSVAFTHPTLEGTPPGAGGDLVFTVSRTATSEAEDVAYALGGTATAGSDYTVPSGTVSFAIGQATAEIHIAITPDATIEPTESVSVTLTGASGDGFINPAAAIASARSSTMTAAQGTSTATARPIFFCRTTTGPRGSGSWTAPRSLAPPPFPILGLRGMPLQRPISTATASPISFGRTMTEPRRSGSWTAPRSLAPPPFPILGLRGMSLQRPISTMTASPISFFRTTTGPRGSGSWTAPRSLAAPPFPILGLHGMPLQRPISTATASPISFGRTMTGPRRSGSWTAPRHWRRRPSQSWAYVACRCSGRFQR